MSLLLRPRLSEEVVNYSQSLIRTPANFQTLYSKTCMMLGCVCDLLHLRVLSLLWSLWISPHKSDNRTKIKIKTKQQHSTHIVLSDLLTVFNSHIPKYSNRFPDPHKKNDVLESSYYRFHYCSFHDEYFFWFLSTIIIIIIIIIVILVDGKCK